MSLKNAKSKPANQIKETPKEATIEQHLGNVAWGINNLKGTITIDQRDAIVSSYNHIHSLLVKKEK